MTEAINRNSDSDVPEPSDVATDPMFKSSAPELVADPQAGDDSWQTVDFPGAMRIDEITEGASSPFGDAEQLAVTVAPAEVAPVESGETDDALPSVAQLQGENSDLRDRLLLLEQDLAQAQIELQLEVARSLYQSGESPFEGQKSRAMALTEPSASEDHTTASQPTEELALAREQIQQLSHELDISQQVVQRQQILVETLTDQLEGGQERIAQLERDCALAQRRYNEQVQMLLQSENTCRDLRMRLHRQQQHALQFKAALEKCLDMSATQRQTAETIVPPRSPEPLDPITTDAAQLVVPKATPVQPWSATEEFPIEHFRSASPPDPSALPNLLSKLLNLDEASGHAPGKMATAEVDSTLSDLSDQSAAGGFPAEPRSPEPIDLIFPTTDDFGSEAVVDSPESIENTVFDLRPFLEAGEADPWNTMDGAEGAGAEGAGAEDVGAIAHGEKENTSLPNYGVDNSAHQFAQGDSAEPIDVEPDRASYPLDADEPLQPELAPEQLAPVLSGNLWEDLAKLVDLDAFSDTPLPAGSKQPAAPEITPGVSPEIVKLVAEIPQPPSDQRLEDGIGNAQVASVSTAWSFTVNQLQSQPEPLAEDDSEASEETASLPAATPPATSANWPSPVLYPFRPVKKRQSLAAVELPTFPRSNHP